MPNRMIRDSARTSPTLAKLSLPALALFNNLVLCADDHGRFLADPVVMLSQCFPTRVTQVSTEQITLWRDEMVTSGLISLYSDRERIYGHFLTWEKYQRIRSATSKYPDPKDCTLQHASPAPHKRGQPRTSADIRGQAVASAAVVEVVDVVEVEEKLSPPSEARLARSAPPEPGQVVETLPTGFKNFYDLHPKKRGRAEAVREWRKLKPDAALQAKILEAVAAQLTWPNLDGGRFMQDPCRWLKNRRWEDQPPTASVSRPIQLRDRPAYLDEKEGT